MEGDLKLSPPFLVDRLSRSIWCARMINVPRHDLINYVLSLCGTRFSDGDNGRGWSHERGGRGRGGSWLVGPDRGAKKAVFTIRVFVRKML